MLATARAVEADVHPRTVSVKRRAEDREFVGPLAPLNQNIQYVLRKAQREVCRMVFERKLIFRGERVLIQF